MLKLKLDLNKKDNSK